MVKNRLLLLLLGCALFAGGYWVGSMRHIAPETIVINRTNTQEIIRVENRTLPIFIVTQEEATSRPLAPAEQDLVGKIHQSFYREALDLVIETMSLTDLIPLASLVTGFRTERLWEMQRPQLFVRKLMEFYLEDCGGVFGAVDAFDPILFAREASPINGTLPPTYFSFERTITSRVYAYFPVPADYYGDEVLVRWCSQNPPRNFIYAPYSIDPQRSLNYVWWQPNDAPMRSGTYFVYIWTATETPRLIALGNYRVVE